MCSSDLRSCSHFGNLQKIEGKLLILTVQSQKTILVVWPSDLFFHTRVGQNSLLHYYYQWWLQLKTHKTKKNTEIIKSTIQTTLFVIRVRYSRRNYNYFHVIVEWLSKTIKAAEVGHYRRTLVYPVSRTLRRLRVMFAFSVIAVLNQRS